MAPGADDDEALGWLRVVAAAVFIGLDALLVVAWVAGRENVEGILGITVAATFTVLGIPFLQRVLGNGRDK